MSLKDIIEQYEDGLYRAQYVREDAAILDVAIHIAATAGEHGVSDPPRAVMHKLTDFTGFTTRTIVRAEDSHDVRRKT